MQEQVSAAEDVIAFLKKEVAAAAARADELEKRKEEEARIAKEQLEALQRECDGQRLELEKLNAPSPQDLESMQEQVAAAEDAIAFLKKEAAAAAARADELERQKDEEAKTAKERLESLERECAGQRLELEKLAKPEADRHEGDHDAEDVDAMREQVAAAEDAIAFLKKAKEDSGAEAAAAQAKALEAQKEMEAMREQLATAEEAVGLLKKAAERNAEEMRSTEGAALLPKVECEERAAQTMPPEDDNDDMKALHAKLLDLEDENARLKRVEEEAEIAKKHLETMERQCEGQRLELQKLATAREEEAEIAKKRLETLERECEGQRLEIQKLATAREEEAETAKKRLETLERQCEGQRLELQRLGTVETLAREAQKSLLELERDKAKLELENEMLRARIEELEKGLHSRAASRAQSMDSDEEAAVRAAAALKGRRTSSVPANRQPNRMSTRGSRLPSKEDQGNPRWSIHSARPSLRPRSDSVAAENVDLQSPDLDDFADMWDPAHMREMISDLFPKHDENNDGYLQWGTGEVMGFLKEFFQAHDFPQPKMPAAVFHALYNQVRMDGSNGPGLNEQECFEFAMKVHDFIYKSLKGEMVVKRKEARKKTLEKGLPDPFPEADGASMRASRSSRRQPTLGT